MLSHFGDFRPAQSGHSRSVSLVAGSLLVVMCLGGLAGCGVSSSAHGDGGVTSTALPPTKTGVKGCAGGTGGLVAGSSPTLVLTLKDADHESTAHVGDVIQVRLPVTQRWTMDTGDLGVLEMLQPAGYWDVSASACIWNFRAAKVGTTTVNFVGMAICEPKQPCPAYAVSEGFPVTVA